MKEKPDVLQGTLALMVLKTLDGCGKKDDLDREERKNVPQGLKGRMSLLGLCTG
jgi:predicted small lipoprotein YifL